MFPCWYCFAWQESWGTILSRLPYCVISRYQRYYPAIRLPAPRLTSFLFWLCVIPRIPYEGETGSPQLMYCHCAAWLALETPREYVKSCHSDKPICWLPHFQLRRLPGLIYDFGANRLVALQPIYLRSAHFVTSIHRRLLPMMWLASYRTGFPPAKQHTLDWAHWQSNITRSNNLN